MSAATALVRSLKAEVRKTVGLPGAWLGAALAIVLPLLIEYYTDHDLAARLAAGDPDAPAQLGNVGVIGLYVGTTGIVVLAVSVVVSEYASDPRTSGASGAPRQVTTTMLVQPRRGASVAAKLLVVLGAATVLLAVAWTATYSLSRHLLGSSVPFEPVPWWMLRDPDLVGVLGNGVDGTGDGDTQRAGVDDGPRRNVDDDLAGGASHQVHRCGPVSAG